MSVHWHAFKKDGTLYKRPFMRTTRATNDLIQALARDGMTWEQMYAAINFDDEAKQVCARYIKDGLGDDLARQIIDVG